MRTQPLRVGTRASELALTQTQGVADALAAASGRRVELVRVRTEGDVSAAPLASLGGTGVFAAALREALLAGVCDVAVHSLKDLPTAPHPGLVVGAVPPRADARDVLCARPGVGLAELPRGARVGTGSPRRAAQLRLARPDLDVVDIRGNVGTRLARVGADLDAVVLARAGLERLGRLDAVTETLEPETMLPAPGQGALAVECRAGDLDSDLGAALARIEDPASRSAATAERAVLAALEAGCAAPVGAHARVTGGRLELTAGVFAPDGTGALRRAGGLDLPASPAQAEAAAAGLGRSLAAALLDAGAADLADLPRRGSADDVPGVLDAPAGP